MTPKTTKRIRNLVIAGLVGFGVLQILPAKKFGIPTEDIGSNPAARFKLDAPPDVEAVLRRACFDCHSNETRWPLYARIAPGSWLMARDVHKGRSHMNFSEWAEHDEGERNTDHENCWEQVESGAMPKWFYVWPMHLSARLSAADKALLKGYFLKHKAEGAATANAKPAAADTEKAAATAK